MDQGIGEKGGLPGSSNPIRQPSGQISIWNFRPADPSVKPQQIFGDRFDSLPPTSKALRRKRGKKITTESNPAKKQKPSESDVGPNSNTGDDRKQAWLLSEPQLETKLGTSWNGKKILGTGSFGIAGLWTLEISEENKDQLVRNVVVKQSGARTADVKAMREEATILKLFKGIETKHIVKMYEDCVAELLVGDQVNPIGGNGSNIARIFIEYCEGGDMRKFLKTLKGKFTAQNPIPEELVWEIFKCLALGLAVMENGNELLDGPKWETEVAHMDIKPENILIANNDNEHLKTPVIKIADFGVSRVVPNSQSIEWMKVQFHTLHYHPPKSHEVDKKYPQSSSYESDDDNYASSPQPTYDSTLRYGSHTNVWGIGKVMYNLINRSHSFANDSPIYWFLGGSPPRPIRTQGPAIKNAPCSPDLRKTVMHCLAVDWRERPNTRQLLKTINDKLTAIANPMVPAFVKAGPGIGLGVGFDAGLTIYPEPTDHFPTFG